jgi:hypothetical protein
MKTACLLVLTIGWGIARAATSGPAFQQPSRESAGKAASDHSGPTQAGAERSCAVSQRRLPGRERIPVIGTAGQKLHTAGLETASPKSRPPGKNLIAEPRSAPARRERSALGNAFPPPAFAKSGGTAKGAFIHNLKSTVPARPRTMVRPAPATLSSVRHRGPNPAVIGGLGNTMTSSTGSISGTGMHRRP